MSFDAGSSRPRAGAATGRPARHLPLRQGLLALVLALGLSACSVIDKPVRPAVYDFGPGPLAAAAPAARPDMASLTLADVDAGAALDSTAVLYRLGYANGQQLLPYAQARWSTVPAQLVRQRLRDRLGQQRTVLGPDDVNAAASQSRLVLRVELEEFSQLFSAPGQSAGLVRLRATAIQAAATGDRLLGQRVLVAQRPAATADAPGGVRALTEATDAAIDELAQWLTQLR